MTPPVPNYAHKATFLSGHDGDSFWLRVDFGMSTHGVKLELPIYVRLYGIDTWEIPPAKGTKNDPDFKKGHLAADFTSMTLVAAKKIIVQTLKPDGHNLEEEKYGRWLARVWADGDELPDLLRAGGHEKQT